MCQDRRVLASGLLATRSPTRRSETTDQQRTNRAQLPLSFPQFRVARSPAPTGPTVGGREGSLRRFRRFISWCSGTERLSWRQMLLLPEASVDSLTQQVGVSVVAGVLFDHVYQQFAQRDWVAVRVAPEEVETGFA